MSRIGISLLAIVLFFGGMGMFMFPIFYLDWLDGRATSLWTWVALCGMLAGSIPTILLGAALGMGLETDSGVQG